MRSNSAQSSSWPFGLNVVGAGGGIHNSAVLDVTATALSGNTAHGEWRYLDPRDEWQVGGAALFSSSAARLVNVQIARNSVSLLHPDSGVAMAAGIKSTGTQTVSHQGTALVDSEGRPNCVGSVQSLGRG